MLQNAYFVAKIGADTAENEQHFAEILPMSALEPPPRPRRRRKTRPWPTPKLERIERQVGSGARLQLGYQVRWSKMDVLGGISQQRGQLERQLRNLGDKTADIRH